MFFVSQVFLPVYGETFQKSAELLSDQSIDEDVPDSVYSNKEFLASGWSYSIDDSNKVKQAITYIKFSLDEIPQSNFWDDVTVNSSELKLFLNSIWTDDDDEQFLVTVSSCSNNQWSEKDITWNNRVCDNHSEIMGQDSIVITRSDVPNFFSWDVVNSIQRAKINNNSEITFLITVFPVEEDSVNDPNEEEYRNFEAGIIWIWSSEKKNVGINAGPNLNITYTKLDSNEKEAIIFAIPVVLAVTPILITLFWKKR